MSKFKRKRYTLLQIIEMMWYKPCLSAYQIRELLQIIDMVRYKQFFIGLSNYKLNCQKSKSKRKRDTITKSTFNE